MHTNMYSYSVHYYQLDHVSIKRRVSCAQIGYKIFSLQNLQILIHPVLLQNMENLSAMEIIGHTHLSVGTVST